MAKAGAFMKMRFDITEIDATDHSAEILAGDSKIRRENKSL